MSKVKIPAEADNGDPLHVPHKPKPEDLVAIIDTAEQLPYDLSPMQMVRGNLYTGDYSLVGLEDEICIERKSLSDFLGVVGGDRERFDREIIRMLAYKSRAMVIEATWEQVETGDWPEYETKDGEIKKSEVTATAALGSIYGWMARGIPVVLMGTRQRSQQFVARALYFAARRAVEDVRRTLLGRVDPHIVKAESQHQGPPEEYV